MSEGHSILFHAGVRADVQRRIEEISVANIAKFRKERGINHSNLSELFTSFLAKVCHIPNAFEGRFTYGTVLISHVSVRHLDDLTYRDLP